MDLTPAVAALILSCSSAAAQIVLAPPLNVTTVSTTVLPPVSAAAGDFDGDGHPDLATLRGPFDHVLTVFRGDGQGGLAALPDASVPPANVLRATHDMDVDGRVDLLVSGTAAAPTALLLLPGRGDGSFDPPLGSSTPGAPSAVVPVDLTGDGLPDLVALHAQGLFEQVVSVLHGAGGGALDLAQSLGVGTLFSLPVALDCGDLDGDGRLDLVTAFAHGTAAHFDGLAGGTFATTASTVPMVSSPAPGSLVSVVLVDLDGDHRKDLVGSDVLLGTVNVRAGQGDGSFGAIAAVPAGGSGEISAGDWDGDGNVDVLVSLDGQAEFSVLRNSGGLQALIRLSTFAPIRGRCVTDLDGDGRDELAGFRDAAPGPQRGIVVVRNATYGDDEPFTDLGGAAQGSAGWPILLCQGTLLPDRPFSLTLETATPGSLPLLVSGGSVLGQAFAGGVLWPLPERVGLLPPVGPDGRSTLEGLWPAGLAGVELWLQLWMHDAGGSGGWAATSGVRILAP